MLTKREQQFLRLILDPGAHVGEIQNAASMFFTSLRQRGVTYEVFNGMEHIKEKPREQESKKPTVMPFGKHKGKALDDIDEGYFQFLLRKWWPELDYEGQLQWKWLHDAVIRRLDQ